MREENALFRDLYPLVEQVRAIWDAVSEFDARNMINAAEELCRTVAQEHDFKPLTQFAHMLCKRAEGIINTCLVKYGTNILEGANGTAKVIKRSAYGYRDFEYFALKLIAAFPDKHIKRVLQNWTLVWNGLTVSLGLLSVFTI